MAKSSFINWENAPIKKEGFIAIFIFMSGLIGEGFYFYNRFITLESDMIEANEKIQELLSKRLQSGFFKIPSLLYCKFPLTEYSLRINA